MSSARVDGRRALGAWVAAGAAAGLRSGGLRLAGALTASVALAAAAALCGPAGAATAGRARTERNGSPMPVVLHASKLSEEPVIRADRAKPPKKVLTRNLVKGTGATVTATSTVTVEYVGANYATGRVFTQVTWKAGEATSFTLRHVVPGFSAGLVGMKVGGRRESVIPPKYGYGTRAEGPIKKHETLVFVVDLEGVSS